MIRRSSLSLTGFAKNAEVIEVGAIAPEQVLRVRSDREASLYRSCSCEPASE